jgi:hypothetical protein
MNAPADIGAEEVLDAVDVEEHVKAGRKPPHAKRYMIRIDKLKYTVDVPKMTGREILALAGKTPETYLLHQILKGGQPEKVGPNEVVDFRESGVEKFRTLPRDQTEGEGGLPARRQFHLPEADRAFLDGLGLRWEALSEAGSLWVMIYGWPLPHGYGRDAVDIAVKIEAGYPTSPLDMAYVHPPLARVDGVPINATQATQALDGKTFQRWSRHRTGANPWVPGEDSLATHLALIEDWLAREFVRRAA